MILVDSSVWIDYFNGRSTPQTDRLDRLLGTVPLATGDLILVEVLQGFRRDEDFRVARELLDELIQFELLGTHRAQRCAEHFRLLRKRGITIRRTVDVVIATFCIEQGHALLHSDRDFQPFHEHLGLRSAMAPG